MRQEATPRRHRRRATRRHQRRATTKVSGKAVTVRNFGPSIHSGHRPPESIPDVALDWIRDVHGGVDEVTTFVPYIFFSDDLGNRANLGLKKRSELLYGDV